MNDAADEERMHLFNAFLHEHTRWTVCSGSTLVTANGAMGGAHMWMDDDYEDDEACDDSAQPESDAGCDDHGCHQSIAGQALLH